MDGQGITGRLILDHDLQLVSGIFDTSQHIEITTRFVSAPNGLVLAARPDPVPDVINDVPGGRVESSDFLHVVIRNHPPLFKIAAYDKAGNCCAIFRFVEIVVKLAALHVIGRIRCHGV